MHMTWIRPRNYYEVLYTQKATRWGKHLRMTVVAAAVGHAKCTDECGGHAAQASMRTSRGSVLAITSLQQ